jgi:hypothetical protein
MCDLLGKNPRQFSKVIILKVSQLALLLRSCRSGFLRRFHSIGIGQAFRIHKGGRHRSDAARRVKHAVLWTALKQKWTTGTRGSGPVVVQP